MTSSKQLAKLAIQGAEGRYWYHHANRHLQHVSNKMDVTPQRFADILALTSPRVSVKRNIKHAIKYLTTGTHNHDVMGTIRRSVEVYEDTGEIRGPKTSAFARALMLDEHALVLDVWMARALNVDQKIVNNKSVAKEITRRVNKACKLLGDNWTPAQLQAAVWCATIKQHNRTPMPFDIKGVINETHNQEIKVA